MVQVPTARLGDILKRYRQEAGLTQEELAERAGLSVRGIKALEGGERTRPHKDTIRLIADALQLSPSERQMLLEAVRQARDGAANVASRSEETPRWSNLPLQLTPFIGREREVASVVDLLIRPSVRLLTLTGPGGIGKTRLALQVAASLRDRFADGVRYVALASLADPALVPSALAQVVGVQEQGDIPLADMLIAALRNRHLLLLLDNLEHLLPASEPIARLLKAAPSLHLLLTSRIPLHLSGEQEYAVPPLSLPDPHQGLSLETVAESEAVMLFVARAQAVMAGFRLTSKNASAVAEICRRLDGLPLAIELAAAHSKLFPPAALLARLSPCLPLLTGGARDLPARLQTIRGTIDWSYGLLRPREKRLLARLAVFAGGCALESAEAICDLEQSRAVVEDLTSLVDQSLVRREGDEEPRLVLLETIREYAQERLEERGELDGLRERHAGWYLAFAEEAARELRGAGQATWLARLDRERDNLRAALQWAQQRGKEDLGLRLAIALSRFWKIRGHLTEGQHWLTELLAAEANIAAAQRAAALLKAGELVFAQGRDRDAAELFERSLALYGELGDVQGNSEALGRLADALFNQGDVERAVDLLTEQVTLARDQGDQAILATALCRLAIRAVWRDDVSQARILGEESLALFRELGDVRGMAGALEIVAAAAYGEGDRLRARALTEEIIALLPRTTLDQEMRVWDEHPLVWAARDRGDYGQAMRLLEALEVRALDLGDASNAAYTRLTRGILARELGDYDQARALIQESLVVFREANDLRETGRALVSLSSVARDQGDPEGVIELCEHALVLFRETGNDAYTATALHDLGLAARYQGDYERAEALLAESLALSRQSAVSTPIVEVLSSVGLLALEQEQYERAHQAFVESLMIARTWMDGTVLEGLAGVAITHGQPERAARLFGAAESFRSTMGIPRWPANEALYQGRVSLSREALGEERFSRVWEEGRAMTMEQAITCALDSVPVP